MSLPTAPAADPEPDVPPVAVPAGASTGRRTLLARGAVLLASVATVAAFLVDAQVPDAHRAAIEIIRGGPDALTGLTLALAGAYVLRRLDHPLGWLMCGFGVWWAIDSACASWLGFATTQNPALPGASTAFWIYQRLGSGLLLLLPLVLLLFPDGRLPRGRWRVAALVSLASTCVLPLTVIFAPSNVAQQASESGTLPADIARLNLDALTIPLPEPAWTVLLRLGFLLVPLSLLVPFAVVVGRYRRARGRRRLQLRWLLWAALVDVLVMLTVRLLPDSISSPGLTLCIAVTAGAVAVGLTRPDIVDVDRLLGSTIVYGSLVVISYLLDLLVLGLAGTLLGAHLSGTESLVVAVFAVSLVYAPLRNRLWTLVRRITRGEREDPYAVVSGLARRLESSEAPDDQLLAVARAVAAAFRVGYVGVEVVHPSGSTVLVEHGRRGAAVDALPISYRGEQIGRLLLPSGPRQRLRSSDERLLADVVRQAAAAARQARLADELQSSREELLTAVEDERRRLRNELHDGLGPSLAAVASRIDLARMSSVSEPAERQLAAAREELTGLLGEVRRLVHGLRPPALDDVGLVGALRQQVERLRAPGTALVIEAPDRLDGLPAAVEVAAYRIASEALTNVVRHAQAARATVRLTTEAGGLVVEVVDDGIGISPQARAGVGLVSLRERARELGGTCTVEPGEAPAGGTVVRATLPLPAAFDPEVGPEVSPEVSAEATRSSP